MQKLKSNLKTEIRNQIRKRRRTISDFERSKFAIKVADQFLNQVLPILQKNKWNLNFRTVAGFSGILEELTLAEEILRMEITDFRSCYVLPRMNVSSVEAKLNELSFYETHKSDILIKNQYGILEPGINAALVNTSKIDWFWTPGVAWDHSGGRLGMGKGFYDRVFKQNLKAIRMGFGYDFQCLDSLPLEPWDQKVDGIILPDEVILLPSFYDKVVAE